MAEDRETAATGIALVELGAGGLPAALAMNQVAVPHVNRLTAEELARLAAMAAYRRLALLAGEPAGFLLALGPEADYASPNFRWFLDRYPSFLYVDRVVVAESARRHGLGRRLYEDLAAFARPRVPILACEVNLVPPNPGSLDFHRRFGFRQVGMQETEGGAKTVALLVRELAPAAADLEAGPSLVP